MNKSKKKTSLMFRALRFVIKSFYPKFEMVGIENLPDKDVIIVANHTQMYSPMVCEFYLPDKYITWCAGEMMHLKEVPAYAFADFWSQKPKSVRWLFKIASYLIAPLSVLVFNNARTIGVYKDARILSTFKNSVNSLGEGNSLIIFPEHDEPHNNIISEFSIKFVDLAKMYFIKHKKRLSFVPSYVAPSLKKMYFGKPIVFDETNSIDDERRRICDYLMDEITDIATSLPLHTVVPYRNIPKKNYPQNISETEVKELEKNKI